jgi:hypothetical protein
MTETRYAHEIVPEPGDDASLADLARYHLARAQGFFAGLMDGRHLNFALARACLGEAHVGFLYHHLAAGLSGQEAANHTRQNIGDGDAIGEWLRQYLTEYGIDPDNIRAYLVDSGSTA